MPRVALVVPFVLALPVAAQISMARLFEAPVLIPGSAPAGLSEVMDLLGNFDNDGDVDVLASTRMSSGQRTAFRPLLNDGSGNLTPGVQVAIPVSSGGLIAAADVDGDGFLDVITNGLLATGPGLWVFRSLGGATWAAPLFVPLPGNCFVLATGNANGDAIADIFVLHVAGAPSFAARWLLGDAALTFPVGPTVSFGSLSIGTGVVLDVDGDGITDFAGLLDTTPGQAAALYRTTPAGLVSYGTLQITPNGSALMVVADMDGDGDEDLQTAISYTSSTQFRLLRNDGAAGFTALAPQTVTSHFAFGVRVVDWDGDGDLDLLTREGGISPGGPVGYDIQLLENVAGAFTQRRTDSFPENTPSLGAGTADLDGDGHADYVEPHALVFGTGAFALRNAAISFPDDWDGDGDLDHVASELRRNDGRGVLTPVAGFRPPPPPNQLYGDVAATADFDGDGRREMLVPLLALPFGQFVDMRRLEVNGDGVLVDVGSASAARINAGLVDDVDEDGDLDVLDGQGLWRNNGTGVFTLVPFAISGFAPAAAGDVDGDLDVDLVGAISQQATVLYRTAPGTFTPTTLTAPGVAIVFAGSARLIDLDDDGDLDLVASGASWPLVVPVVTFVNTGGVFAPGVPLAAAGSVVAGDVDGDGLTDLCVTEQNLLRLLRRVGPGLTYAPPTMYVWRHARAIGDLDQDGDFDLPGESTLWNRRFDGPTAGERRQYGTGGAGTGGYRPLLSLRGPLRTGLTTDLRVVAAPGGSLGVVFVSSVEANVPQALPGVTSWIGASFPALVGMFGGAPGQPGSGVFDLSIAIPPGANGARMFLQCVLLDPAMPIGLGYSNGCELFVGL